MLKQLAWNTFKNTGDINTFLEFKEIQNVEENIINNMGNINYGDNKDKRNSDTRK